MKKRILAMLLAFVMLVGALPINAFAAEAADPAITPCETEGCEYASGHEGDCSNYVAPTEPCTTEGCTYGANHEGNCSTASGEEEHNTAEDQAEEGQTEEDQLEEGQTEEDQTEDQAAEDQAAAQAVTDLIAAIGEVTAESEKAITAAETAYNALTDTQKALVTNYETLTAAKAAYGALSVPTPITQGSAESTQNKAPVLKDGVEATAQAQVKLGESYTLDLTTIFEDEDSAELTYKVKIGDSEAVEAAASYSCTPAAAGTQTLVFTANDGALDSPAYTVVLTTTEVSSEKPVLNFMVNASSNAANSNPQKAVLGEDGILRIENRSASVKYLWLGTTDNATVTSFELIQGLEAKRILPAASNRTSNNVFDGTTYQTYYSSLYYQLPLVARATLTAADGVTTASYYIIVSSGTAGQYVSSVTGFTADSDTYYNAASGITFAEADSKVTLTPTTANIGTGEAQGSLAWEWSSSNPSVAIVDENGTVTSIGGGSATIRATYHQLSVSCTVTSTAPVHNVHSYIDGACSVCGTKEPAARKAYFTLVGQNGSFVISKDGSELYQKQLSVSDADMDGAITLYDAFLCAHESHSINGTADFATQSSEYGPFVVKLWGVETSNVGYYRNHASVNSLTEELKANDNLLVYFYRDTTNWSDIYTYFADSSVNTVEDRTKTISVKGAGGLIPAGATVKVCDSTGNEINELTATVGADGSFAITFPEAGSYTLELGGTADYTGSAWDAATGGYVSKDFTDAPVIPSRVSVTVYPYTTATVYVTLSDKTGNFVTGKNGDELYRIAVKTEDDQTNPNGQVTLQEVLVELHKQHHPNGTDAVSVSGSWIAKLWGDTSGCFGYYFNDVYMSGSGTKTGTNGRPFQDKLMNTVVADGDYFNLWIYQSSSWSDAYTYFDPVNETAVAGETKTFTAKGAAWGSAKAPAGAAIQVKDSNGAELSELATTVADDGTFAITFPKAGTYTVELRTNGSKYFVPSRCTVTVTKVGADDAVVYVSGAKNGTLFLANQPVTVKDLNADGLLSYDEAMQAAHEKYCPDGYVSSEGTYGLQVGKLWGEGDGDFANALFYNNDAALQMNVGESYVQAGDRLYACVLKYSDSWGDVYSYFDKTALTVNAGEEFTLTLNGSSYMGSTIKFDDIKVGTWSGGTFTAISDKTFDENGQVTLSFAKAGTYIISAEGEFYDDYGSLCPIMPPMCEVTVTAVDVQSVTLNKNALALTIGMDETLTATVLPENATDKTVTWTTSNDQVATVDTDGKVTAAAAGTATITAKVGDQEDYCEVTVTESKETLSVLKFASSSSAAAAAYTMTPAFDPLVKEYTVVVPDSTASLYAWAALGEGTSGSIVASYTNTGGAAKTVTLTSGKTTGTSLSQTVASGKLTGNTLTVTIGETVYTVNIVRQATLSKLVVTVDEETVTLTPTFNATKFEYSADVAHDAVVSVAPTVKSSGAVATVNGGTETSVTPVWTDRSSDLVVKVSGGEGTVDSIYTIHLAQLATKIEILTPPAKTTYTVGESFDPTGMTLKATYSDGFTETIEKDAYTYTPTGPMSQSVTEIEVTFDGLSVKQPITIPAMFEGEGTQTAPYLIKTTADLVLLSDMVASGLSFSGEYFRMTAPITLPDAEGDDAWVPIGVNKNKPFSGNFDGGNYLLTVPEGGLPLIGFPAGATLSNLDIYGTRIAGFGVVNGYAVGATITIDKVTLKTGTQTLYSGFIGGYASGTNTVTIKNSTVESGVVIGYDKQQGKIGSFAGDYNGTIDNCVSYATVYGTDFVGGIAGCKGQSMGAFAVTNCRFYGTVSATGNYVGGIVGHGYGGTQWGISSAPNAPCITIQNCECSGTIKGGNYVGGILGAESGVAQCWENGIGYIQNNKFTGTVAATGGSYVGGIIGYMRSLNKFNVITNNYYAASCGASKGIGGVEYVDTNCTTHETASGATYLNTETDTSGCPAISGCAWKKAHNRTDDPLGADAAKLCYTDTQKDPVAVELKISGTYKTEYTTGDQLDLTGIVLTVVYNDDSAKNVELKDVTVTGFDTDKAGEQSITISYNGLTASVKVNVQSSKTELTVKVSILGDSVHNSDSDGKVHTLAGGNLSTWISAKSITVDTGATAWDAIKQVLDDAGFSYRVSWSSMYNSYYIESVKGLAEFTNGQNSGWMCTVNGVHISVGVSAYTLNDGDMIVLHYTDDYNKEYGGIGDNTDAKAVEEAEKLIDAIGTVTLNSKTEIDAARKAYDDLTYTQKKLVGNYVTLTAAETKYAELKAADDEKKAEAVEDLIEKIRSGATTFEDDVKAAQKAYNDLTADQKKLVDNYYKLVNALKELADEEDKEAAEAVEKLIDAIGIVTKDSEERIKAARDAYEKLTDEQKALVENLAILEEAEKKLEELKALASVADIYETTGEYLEDLGMPGIGSVGGEWMVVGLTRSGREIEDMDSYYKAVVLYVQENIDENARLHRAKSTDNSRMILALTAIGKDVTDVGGHNLLNGLNSMEFIQKQGINGPIWALIAFDSGNYPTPEGDVSRQALIQVLLDAQLADGGWALSGETSDPDITGMALQALAPYYKLHADVKAAIDEALATLSEMQAADGSYASIDGTSSESISQVIVALAALGIDADKDARFIKNGISALDALCAFYVEGGGFRHIPTGKLDGMATEQGYYALAAYFRMLAGEKALYNMTDVIDMGGGMETVKPAETLPAQTEPVETKPAAIEDEANEGSLPWWIRIVILVSGVAVAVAVPVTRKRRS